MGGSGSVTMLNSEQTIWMQQISRDIYKIKLFARAVIAAMTVILADVLRFIRVGRAEIGRDDYAIVVALIFAPRRLNLHFSQIPI